MFGQAEHPLTKMSIPENKHELHLLLNAQKKSQIISLEQQP